MELPSFFKNLSELYAKHGFKIYLVGGTSRDLLLDIPLRDFDLATDATPEEEKLFLTEADYTFEKYGSIKTKIDGIKLEITTFRRESGYGDYRHPAQIEFIRDMEEDSKRRDFTINAIYIDASSKVYDFHEGVKDLHDGVIRLIGDPEKRIVEDPLRILRADRFAKRLGFTIDRETQKAMFKLNHLLSKLNPEKVKMEARKG